MAEYDFDLFVIGAGPAGCARPGWPPSSARGSASPRNIASAAPA